MPENNPEFLVIGKGGQLASAFEEILGVRAVYLGLPELDLLRPGKILPYLNKFSPKAIINTAAYTAVDKAEEEENLATVINGDSVGVLAAFCQERNIPLVHYSTDYVFSGKGDKPWKEDDKVEPLNAYGRSKLEGEEKAEIAKKHLIFRTSWVYDHSGKNFLTAMMRLGKEREEIMIVGDQYGAPTYALHLAKYSLQALETALAMPEFPSGIYHMAGGGITTWYEFALSIFGNLQKKNIPLRVKKIVSITAKEYKTPAKRPYNSRLDMSKLRRVFGIVMPDWVQGLRECVERI